MEQSTVVTRHDALELIDYLKGGTIGTLPYAAHYLHVDRDSILDRIKETLEATSHHKYFKLYLNADIGSGKTILLRKIQHMALQQDFVVSFVSASASDIRFNRLETVYHHVMLNLQDRYGNKSAGVLKRIFETLEGDPGEASELQHPEVYDSFRTAKSSPNSGEQIRALFNWLQGGREIPWTIKKEFRVRGFVGRETCMGYLSDLSRLMRYAGYGGLVILMDEMEAISKINNVDYRLQAWLNIQEIHNNKWDFENCYVVYAGTPYFYSGEKGIGEQPQVKRRIEPNVFDLKPLSKESVAELISRVAGLFDIVRGFYPPQNVVNATIANVTVAYKNGRGDDLGTALAHACKELDGYYLKAGRLQVSSRLVLTVHTDPLFQERKTAGGSMPNQEWLDILNKSNEPVTLDGAVLVNSGKSGQILSFPERVFALKPGDTLRVFSGKDNTAAADASNDRGVNVLHLKRDDYLWAESGVAEVFRNRNDLSDGRPPLARTSF